MNDLTYLITKDLDEQIICHISPHDMLNLNSVNKHYHLILATRIKDIRKCGLNFKKACELGIVWIAQWLVKVDKEMQQFRKLYPCMIPYIQLIVDNVRDYFIIMIEQNHLEMAQWFFDQVQNGSETVRSALPRAFNIACSKGHLGIAKWIITLPYEEAVQNVDNIAFCLTCEYGHINVAEWLFDLGQKGFCEIDIHAHNDRAFKNACFNNQIEITKWLLNKTSQTKTKIKMNNTDVYTLFKKACTNDNLEMAKCLFDRWDIDLHLESESIFRIVCEGGKLAMVKWLYEISFKTGRKIDIHISDEYVFRVACRKSNLDLVRLLIDMSEEHQDRININAGQSAAFQSACENNHMTMAEYLIELGEKSHGKIDIHFDNEFAFQNVCKRRNLLFAKWLVKLGNESYGPVDIHARDDGAFYVACANNAVHIAKWLMEIAPNHKYIGPSYNTSLWHIVRQNKFSEIEALLHEIKNR